MFIEKIEGHSLKEYSMHDCVRPYIDKIENFARKKIEKYESFSPYTWLQGKPVRKLYY